MKKITSILLTLIIAVSLTACGTNLGATNDNPSSQTAVVVAFPMTITDQAGRTITIESKPETIVSGYYISSSILIALGLSDKLVGIEAKANKRPIYSLAAPELIDLPNVGSAKEFDLEGCAALNPDLIILPKKLKDAAASLEELGLKVILINPESTDDLLDAISIISNATGTVQEGEALTGSINQTNTDLAGMVADLSKPTVYMASNSALLETASAKMYQSSMIENAGGTNVASEVDDTYWTAISYEQLLDWNPEYIVIAAEAEYTVDDVLSDSNISECAAVKNGNVYAMPCDIEAWDSPVPGGILGSLWLANILHSDKVDDDYYEQSVKNFYESFYGFTK